MNGPIFIVSDNHFSMDNNHKEHDRRAKLSKVFDKNNLELTASSAGVYTLQNDQVYTLVLNNHTGVSFQQDQSFPAKQTIQNLQY